MKKIRTLVGDIWVRNEWDEAVVKEVIDEDQYRRWGDITIKKDDVVIDCGAHIGVFTRLALFYKANVLAVEPDEENFKMLLRNTQWHNVRLVKGLLYNGEDVKFLADKKRGELSKISSRGKLVIPSIELNDLVRKFKIEKIDLLKIDIEGSEYQVLYHFKNLEIVQQLSIEWHYGSTKMAKLLIYLEKQGFTTVWIGGNGQWGKLQLVRKT